MEQVTRRMMAHLEQRLASSPFLSMAEYIATVLYTPAIGYYQNDRVKIGPEGDFTTAPEMSKLFSWSIAEQLLELFSQGVPPVILEFGAGHGTMAYELLTFFHSKAIYPQYFILDISTPLSTYQKKKLHFFSDHITWLQELPMTFSGVILANEVLDAMPCELFYWQNTGYKELGVTWHEQHLALAQQTVSPEQEAVLTKLTERYQIPTPYLIEINTHAQRWLQRVLTCLKSGVLWIFDYGFPGHVYYHPERLQGTLMCHQRHRIHHDVFNAPGCEDITTHVDFSAVAEVCQACGADVLGYTTQAAFLLNCDLLRHVTCQQTAREAHMLTSGTLGEVFKVCALGKNISHPLKGFQAFDKAHELEIA